MFCILKKKFIVNYNCWKVGYVCSKIDYIEIKSVTRQEVGITLDIQRFHAPMLSIFNYYIKILGSRNENIRIFNKLTGKILFNPTAEK